MTLSDRDIRKCIEEGKIKINPLPDLETHLGPCAVDLTLDNTMRVFEYSKISMIDPRQKELFDSLTREVVIEDDEPFIVHPGELIIACTKEWIEISDDLIGRLEGRSSLGRLGIIVHSTAARFDPGWRGKAVLELGNLGRVPVALFAGMKICAFTFEQLTSPAQTPYTLRKSSKYVDQNSPAASKLAEEKF